LSSELGHCDEERSRQGIDRVGSQFVFAPKKRKKPVKERHTKAKGQTKRPIHANPHLSCTKSNKRNEVVSEELSSRLLACFTCC
jgi:hypothetical protein